MLKLNTKQNERLNRYSVNYGSTANCWPWRGPMFSNGYGLFRVNGREHVAHRVMYEQWWGRPVPIGGVTQVFKARESKRTPNHLGYLTAHMRDTVNGRRKVYRIHRLVAEAFIPNPDGKPYINHIDCDVANNRIENLEWCTQAENLAHSRALGRMQNDYWKGKVGPNAGRRLNRVR